MSLRHITGRLLMIVVLLTLVLFAVTGAQAGAATMTIRQVEAKDFPKIVTTVTMPSELATQTLTRKNFSVKENGDDIDSFEVNPVDKARKPIAIILAIDASGSMQGKPIFDAKDAARVFIDQMKPNDKIAIVSFADAPLLVSGFSSDKTALYNALESIQANGGTSLYDGLVLSTQTAAQEEGAQKNIVVLSDGADTASTHSMQEVIDKAKTESVTVFSFGLASDDFVEGPLRDISTNTSGSYELAGGSEALAGFYARLAKEIHNQYEVVYTSRSKIQDIQLEISANTTLGPLTALKNFRSPVAPAKPKPTKTDEPEPISFPFSGIFSTAIAIPTIFSMIFAVWFIIFAVFLSLFLKKRSVLRDQIKLYENAYQSAHDGAPENEPNGYLPDNPTVTRMVNMTSRLAEKGGVIQDIQQRIERAGLPIRASEFIFIHVMGVLGVGLLGAFLFESWFLKIGIVLLAAPLPLILLVYLEHKRESRFHEQLPDTLTLIAGALKAGYSFLQAVDVTVQETTPPISDDFKRVLAETRLGLPVEEALEHMAQRVRSTNFDWTVMAVKIQREVGGNLAEVLETLADTIRQRDTVSRQIKVLTAEGRLSAMILFLLPLVIGGLLYILNPIYISRLYTTTIGLSLIGVASLLMIIGAVWLKKIVTIEV